MKKVHSIADQPLEIEIQLDIADNMTLDEFVELWAEALVMGKPIPFKEVAKQFNLKDRRVYVRVKELPDMEAGERFMKKRPVLKLGC